MSRQIEDKIDTILDELKQLREDVNDLKRFKNRVLGGLAVFVFIVQLMGNYIFGGYR